MNNPLFNIIQIQLKEFIREPEVLFWAVLFPIAISGVLGFAFANRGDAQYRVAIVGEQPLIASDGTALPDTLYLPGKQITQTKVKNEAEAQLKLKRGEITIFVVQQKGKTKYFFDKSNAEAELAYFAMDEQLNNKQIKLIASEIVPITTKGNRYIDFLIPGLIAMGIMNSCIWGIGWNLIDFRIKKMLRRMVATPMKKSTFLFAHIVTRFIISFLEALLLVLFAVFVFGVEIQGSILALLILYSAGILAFSGIAVFVSSRAEKAAVGNGIINAVVLPMTILSGIFFSYHNFPLWAQKIVQFFPLTMLADSIRRVFNEGIGINEILLPSALLTLIGIAFFSIGIRIYKWH